jgi:hypothetical protein
MKKTGGAGVRGVCRAGSERKEPMSEVVQFEIDPVLCEKITAQANRQNISVNQLLADAVNLYLETEKEREWRAGLRRWDKIRIRIMLIICSQPLGKLWIANELDQ